MYYFGLHFLCSYVLCHLFQNIFAFMKDDLGDLKCLHATLLNVMESN